MPVKRLALQMFRPAKQWNKALSIYHLMLFGSNACNFHQCRIEIMKDDWFITNRSGPNFSRPANDAGHSQAAFVEKGLSGAQRKVLGDCPFAAIVRHENQNRVLGETESVQFGHDLANSIVNAFEHGRERWIVPGLARTRFVFEFLQLVRLRIEPRVRGLMGQVQKEWFGLRPLDELQSFKIEPIREILARQPRRDIRHELIGVPVAAACDISLL